MRPARRANFRKCREFVEAETGRGSATAKFTTNPNTALSANRKNAVRKNLTPRTLENILKMGGVTTTNLRSKKKSLVFINMKRNSPYITAVHESTHVAYSRIRTKHKLRIVQLASEVLASLFQLEWNLKNNKPKYDRIMATKAPGTLTTLYHIIEANLTKNRNWGKSTAGFGLAKQIQQICSEEERKRLREKLLYGDYKSELGIYAYLLGFLSGARKRNRLTKQTTPKE
ncbi:MAG: hypothetical protein WCW13_02130 [archaeon]|jgi:hypothetical protein